MWETVYDIIIGVGPVVGLCAVIWQLRRSRGDQRARDADLRVERSLALFADMAPGTTTGDSLNRLSDALRIHGTELVGATTWHRLSDADLEGGRFLDHSGERRDRLVADLDSLNSFFERVRIAWVSGLLDENTVMRTLGFHCWWWGQLLTQVRGPKASEALRVLAEAAQQWSTRMDRMQEWTERCATDFDGQRPRRLDRLGRA